ncbi:MAG TPA: hypothetical protein VE870_17230 [Bacteroidales bacterium]|nr:hypothetical protein [Bacteroidales bacterium]
MINFLPAGCLFRKEFSVLIFVLIFLVLTGTGAAEAQDSPAFTHHDIKERTDYRFDTVYLQPLGKRYEIGPLVSEYQSEANMGGNTSVRNVSPDALIWKNKGYFQRNRDLGQVFIPKKDTRVKSIVLRTGPAQSAVLHNTPGSKVFIQFFEITGDPVINDNNTPKGTESKHGFSTNHRTDDYIGGVEYHSLPTIYTGIFPEDIPVTKDENGDPLGDEGCLYYIRWSFKEPVFFKANHRYGFMVGFLEPGPGLGFTLANANRASVPAEPSLDDEFTPYQGGWAFRREGNGTLPPKKIPGENPPGDSRLVEVLKAESLFPQGNKHFDLTPVSNGFPDVDTYRAFEFYIEEK